MAQATVERLQQLLGEKDHTLNRLRFAAAESRRAAAEEARVDRARIAELQEALHKQEAAAIASLRRVLEEAEGRLPPAAGAGPLGAVGQHKHAGESYQKLLELLAEREKQMAELTAAADERRARADSREAALADQLAGLQADVGRLVEELSREKSRGPSKALGALVAKLKARFLSVLFYFPLFSFMFRLNRLNAVVEEVALTQGKLKNKNYVAHASRKGGLSSALVERARRRPRRRPSCRAAWSTGSCTSRSCTCPRPCSCTCRCCSRGRGKPRGSCCRAAGTETWAL